MRLFRKRVSTLRQKIHKLEDQIRDLEREAILSCKHPKESIRELPMHQYFLGGCEPPRRICVDCGLTIEGFSWLRTPFEIYGDVQRIHSDEYYKLRTRGISNSFVHMVFSKNPEYPLEAVLQKKAMGFYYDESDMTRGT